MRNREPIATLGSCRAVNFTRDAGFAMGFAPCVSDNLSANDLL